MRWIVGIILSHYLIASKSFQFQDISYDQLYGNLIELNTKNGSKLVLNYYRLETAKELLKIPEAKQGHFSCSSPIIRITDFTSIKEDSTRPQVLISGEIHGDERVGPLVSFYVIQLLVHSVECVINQNLLHCKWLEAFDPTLTIKQMEWFAFLATRRDIWIIPTANCLGYIRHLRDDFGVDPNRDFPYVRSNSKCLRSTTAKIFDALVHRTLIQMVVTFHGGMVALGYEWGSLNHIASKGSGHNNDYSPDHHAHQSIGQMLSLTAGYFQNEPSYPVGTINSLIYPVDGGMEDWFYAAGWDPINVKNCTNGPYHVNAPDNRALVFLIETSNKKSPRDESLGHSEEILNKFSSYNGHVPRNIRLVLNAIDYLQPYTCWRMDPTGSSGSNGFHVQWYVGGASTVDATFLTLQRGLSPNYSSNPWKSYMDQFGKIHELFDHFLTNPAVVPADANIRILSNSLHVNGSTRWSTTDPFHRHPTKHLRKPRKVRSHGRKLSKDSLPDHSMDQVVPTALYRYDVSAIQHLALAPGSYWIIAWSLVDQRFGSLQQGDPPSMNPQSHLANVRTNLSWHKILLDRQVIGYKHWPSEPIVIHVESNGKMKIESVVMDCKWWNRMMVPDDRRATT